MLAVVAGEWGKMLISQISLLCADLFSLIFFEKKVCNIERKKLFVPMVGTRFEIRNKNKV